MTLPTMIVYSLLVSWPYHIQTGGVYTVANNIASKTACEQLGKDITSHGQYWRYTYTCVPKIIIVGGYIVEKENRAH